MVLRLTPQSGLFDADVQLVRESTPVQTSAFYLRRPYFVPWSAEPSVFILETDEPDQPHTFLINRSDSVTLVPGQSPYTVSLQMVKGANRIEVSTATQKDVVTVAATAVESWFQVLGREYYLSVGQRLDDIVNHYLTPWTTRVAAHLLPFTDLFLPARMPKIQQTRLAIMTSVGQRLGYGDGVRQMATAVSYSTPFVSNPFEAEKSIPGQFPDYPYVTTHPTTGEAQGRVLDLWSPNVCLAAHQALFKLALAIGGPDVPDPAPLRLIAKDDRQLLLSSNGGPTEVHTLDPLAPGCDDIEFNTSCDASVRAFAQAVNVIQIIMSSPQLPLDEEVELPLNFGFYDEGNFFDASGGGHTDPGLGGGDDEHDTVDPDDPFGDGFLGFSLSRRFDHPGCLDTRVQIGERLSKFTAPIVSSSPPALTPEPPIVEGNLLTVDAEAGAPNPTIGTTTFWATSSRTYVMEGDQIRFEAPDLETQILSAYPVLDDPDQIIKSDTTTTSQTGSTASLSAVSAAGIVTVTGLTNMSTESTSRHLTFGGAAEEDNENTFPIDTYNSATSVDIDVSTGLGGSTAALVTPASGAAASMAAAGGGVITVTGLSGMTMNAENRTYLTISGAATAANNGTFRIVTYNSGTSVDIDATGVAATGTLETVFGSAITDADTFILDDGANPAVTFEFDDDGSVVPSATLRPIDFDGTETPDEIRDLIIAAVNSAPALDITAVPDGYGLVGLTNDAAGTAGNVAITQGGTAPLTVSGMSGGIDPPPGADANNGALTWSETDATGADVTLLSGLSGMTPSSVGNYITISGAALGGNNATFEISVYLSAVSVYVLLGAAPGGDPNSGSLTWVETTAPGADANNGALDWVETVDSTNVSFAEKILTGPVGFFEVMHEAMGVQVDGTELYCIVKVSADGSQITLSGNPAALPTGPFITNVYEPLRDRQDESEPDDSVLQGVAGNATYEINVVTPLAATLSTGDQASYRVAPRVAGDTSSGVVEFSIMSDAVPRPGDLLHFSSGVSASIFSAIENGTHHTTGFPLYDVRLEIGSVTPSAYTDDDPLFVLRADACWLNGDPVTPLMILSLDPGSYLTY
jgi:hypothetical protein